MVALKIITVVVGLAFVLFGYFIFFRKKYSLINGFEEDHKADRKNEAYARRVGMVELVVGTAILIAAGILLAFA